jgi:hypothetical protein
MTRFIPKIEFPTYENLIIEVNERDRDFSIWSTRNGKKETCICNLRIEYDKGRWKRAYTSIYLMMMRDYIYPQFVLALKDLTSLLDFLKERGLAYSSEEVGEYKNINQYL